MRQPLRHRQRDIVAGRGELDLRRRRNRFCHGSGAGAIADTITSGWFTFGEPLNLAFLRGDPCRWPPARLRGLKLARPPAFATRFSAPDSSMDHATPDRTSAASSLMRIVDVLVPVALNQAYSYRVPRGMDLEPGDVVCVPLGSREVIAVVWAENANPDPRLHNRLKDVGEKLDVPPLREGIAQPGRLGRQLHAVGARHGAADDVADGRTSRARTGADRGAVDRRSPAAHDAGAATTDRGFVGWIVAQQIRGREGGRRQHRGDGRPGRRGHADVEAMPRAPGRRRRIRRLRDRFFAPQRTAADAMRTLAANGSFRSRCSMALLARARPKSISRPSPNYPTRPADVDPDAGDRAHRTVPRPLCRAFRGAAAGVHLELTPRTRARNWAAIAAGEAPVVVGARSALFLPYANLGLIIVDEEHDQAYKQDEGAHYHARDMAVVRAQFAKIPIVLASATPSLETEVNARKGRYQRVVLPSALRRPAHAAYRGDRCAPRRPDARPLHLAAAGRGDRNSRRAARAGAAICSIAAATRR